MTKKWVKRWSDQSEVTLQNAMENVSWNVFHSSSGDISEFAEAAVGFIATLADDIIPTATVRCYSSRKPWVDVVVRAALKSRTAAYNSALVSGNMDEYKGASYEL